MLKRILIPLDGTKFSDMALEKGLQKAKRTKARLTGLCVVDEPNILKPESTPMGAGEFLEHKHEQLLNQAREKAAELAAAFEARCKKESADHGVKTRIGNPADEIIQEAYRHDLILMGRESHFKYMTQKQPCNTSAQILKEVPRPVMIVPDQLLEGNGVLLTTDGSRTAHRAVQMFQLMGLPGTRNIKVISIHKHREVAAKNCADVDAYLSVHGFKTELFALESDQQPWEVLMNYVRANLPETVVMGAYGSSGLKTLLMGSVTGKFIERTPVPLFIYH